jgi:predicted lipoprotein with Yx(FWY)xxD motif
VPRLVELTLLQGLGQHNGGDARKGRDLTVRVLALAGAVLASAVAAALPQEAPAHVQAWAKSSSPTLKMRTTRFGKVLFAGNGRVLYGFTRDRRGGPSQCYGDCAAAWPVYYAKGTLTVGAGVKRSLLGTVRRRDGRRQVTYNGWPLYYYAHEKAGEIKCQNVATHGGTWLVVRANGTLVR